MRLTVLGSGTLAPSPTRASPGFYLEAADCRLQIDCGAGTMHAMARLGLPWWRLSHVLVTHFHIDHLGELPALIVAMKYALPAPRPDLDLVIAGPVGLRHILHELGHLFGEDLFQLHFDSMVMQVDPDADLGIGRDLRLRTAKTAHTPESLAYRVDTDGRSIGFTGDTAPDPGLAAFFAGASCLVAECALLTPTPGRAHLDVASLGELATRAGVAHLVVTHAGFDPDAERLGERLAAVYPGRITIAADGMAIDV
jgi:ribonuclease BN (tRNA processing enzyme)